MDITILASDQVEASRSLLAALGVALPEGTDVTVTVGNDTVRILREGQTAYTAYPGYPTVIVGEGDEERMLPFPVSWAAAVDWAYNPPAEPGDGLSTIMTHLAFRKRFTFAERTAIETAAVTDPEVRTVQKDFEAAQEIDLTYPDTIQGVGLLVTKGLLTQDRANAVLGIAS